MDHRRIATVLTVLVLVAILLWAVRGRQREEVAPENLVWTLVEAIQKGDVDRYLGCFSGDLRRQLENYVSELSPQGFADYLRSSAAPLTGVAVYDVVRSEPGRAALTVEYVYRDATERQRMELAQNRGEWTISGLEPSKRAKPLIPYGAPAAPMPVEIDQSRTGEEPTPTGGLTP